jgi:hypothetical protein
VTRLFCILFLALAAGGLAQTDSLTYNAEASLKEGVYLSYTDFRRNSPVPKEAIQSKDDKTQLDFIGKSVVDNKEIVLLIDGAEKKFETSKLWGYSQNNTLYLNYESRFYRVPVFGNISHFVGTVEVYNYNTVGIYGGGVYGMGGVGPVGAVKQREVRQFLFDFYSGEIMDYNLANVELMISRDLPLYEEFMKLKKNKRREMMMMFVRKFNAAHPVKFPAR